MDQRSARGNAMLEAVMFLPVLFLLLFGMVEFARLAWTYHTLNKILYSVARYVGTQQGVNYCDEEDPAIVAAKTYGLTGGSTNTGATPVLETLTAEMIAVRIERYNTDTGSMDQCECSAEGCDASAGGRAPDFIVVYLPDGYPARTSIPFAAATEFVLRPQVRVPVGGG